MIGCPLPPLTRRRGSVLLLVLWLLILLGLVGISYSHSVQTQVRVATARGGKAEAYWAARSGIESARAILAGADLTGLTARDGLFDDEKSFAHQKVGLAEYSLIARPAMGEEKPIYGLIDESAKADLNKIGRDLIQKLPGISEDMLQSMIDWMDTDDERLPQGAERDYYEALEYPYLPSNQPFISVRELVRVRGWEDLFEAAEPDPYRRFSQRPGIGNAPAMEPAQARALLDLLTVWAGDSNVAPDGQTKLDLSKATESEMTQRISGLQQDEAKAIVAFRGSGGFSKPTDLLNVTEPRAENAENGQGDNGSGAQGGNTGNQPEGGGNAEQGKKVFTLARVGELIDWFAPNAQQAEPQLGRINLNTAPSTILSAIQEMDGTLAQLIIDQREGRKAYKGPGEIAALQGMTEEKFVKLHPILTAESRRFRVVSQGLELASGARANIEAVLSVEEDDVEIVYWREF